MANKDNNEKGKNLYIFLLKMAKIIMKMANKDNNENGNRILDPPCSTWAVLFLRLNRPVRVLFFIFLQIKTYG